MADEGFKGHRFEISGGPQGWDTVVKIDGVQMQGVTGYALGATAQGMTQVTVSFIPGEMLVDVEADVVRGLPVEQKDTAGMTINVSLPQGSTEEQALRVADAIARRERCDS